jgi:hypothetical protein
MPGTAQHIFILRLALATMLALFVPWILGPEDSRFRGYALSLTILTLLAGVLRNSTKEGGLVGEMSTGAMALLLITPAVGVRTSRVADAVFTATHIAPQDALFQLPAIAQTAPNASGPLLAGAGLAIAAVCGRLGAVYTGALVGAAAAAWVGQTLAMEAGVAMRAERFEDAVLYSQAMRFVGIMVVIGGVAGFPFYRRGKTAWRTAMNKVIYDERMAVAQARRTEEIERVKAAHTELKARESAALAQKAKEAAEQEQALVIDDLEVPDSAGDAGDEGAPESIDTGEGGGFGEEDHELEAEPDDDGEPDGDATDTQDQSDSDSSEAEATVPEPAPLELEPRFDIESPIVITVTAEDSDPDVKLSPAAISRMRRVIGGLLIFCSLTAIWAATPPWFDVLNALPQASTDIAVPFTDPGLSIARTPMNPLAKNFDAELEKRKHGRLHGAAWSCLNDTANFGKTYGRQMRAIEQLAVPADTPVIDIYPAVQQMRRRGVYRVGLTGRADPPYGPMGALFAWPAVQVLVDRPPRAVQWFSISSRSVDELPLLPGRGTPQACALLVDDEVTIRSLFHTVRSLGSIYGDTRCKGGIALVFPEDGTTTNSNPAWRGCP